MNNPSFPFSIFPLGDSAITIDLGNYIDEQRNITALAVYEWLRARPVAGVLDIIMAYSSVSVFYDPVAVGPEEGYPRMEAWLRQAWEEVGAEAWREAGVGSWREEATNEASPTISAVPAGENRLWELPVCYEGEYAPDMDFVMEQCGIPAREVVELHTAVTYRVYMIGFLPGFPYLGSVDQRLHVSRKAQPVPVRAGGIGIAGRQTGVYSLNSPGGWPIIGRTPVRLFQPHSDPPVRIQTGDRVRFYPMTPADFKGWSGVPDSKPFQ